MVKDIFLRTKNTYISESLLLHSKGCSVVIFLSACR